MIPVLPDKLHTVVHAGLVETHALRSLCEWYESPAEAIVVQGGTGSGKTRGAAWLFEFALHRAVITASGQRRGPLWCDAPGLATIAPWDDRWRSTYDVASLIVIDDVGTEPAAGDGPARMTAAIERAFNVSAGRFVITTNLDAEAFGRRYGDRVRSRLCQSLWVTTLDPDYREEGTSTQLTARRKWPHPRAQSRREREASKRAEQAQAAEDAEWERTAAERAKWAADAQAKLVELAARKPEEVEPHADDERRRELRRQLEELHRGQA